jgi:hypothetical protein
MMVISAGPSTKLCAGEEQAAKAAAAAAAAAAVVGVRAAVATALTGAVESGKAVEFPLQTQWFSARHAWFSASSAYRASVPSELAFLAAVPLGGLGVSETLALMLDLGFGGAGRPRRGLVGRPRRGRAAFLLDFGSFPA